MSDNDRAMQVLTDKTVVDYVLLDEYLRTFELFGCTTIEIASVRAVIEESRRLA